MKKERIEQILSDHKKYLQNLGGCCADLRGADLRGAGLIGADIDFSCLPLWCGSLSAKFDDKQIKQFIYHIVKAGLYSPNVSDKIKAELEKLIPLANDFHRAKECGIIAYKSP